MDPKHCFIVLKNFLIPSLLFSPVDCKGKGCAVDPLNSCCVYYDWHRQCKMLGNIADYSPRTISVLGLEDISPERGPVFPPEEEEEEVKVNN